MPKHWKSKKAGKVKIRGRGGYNVSNGTIFHGPQGTGKVSTGSGCAVLAIALVGAPVIAAIEIGRAVL